MVVEGGGYGGKKEMVKSKLEKEMASGIRVKVEKKIVQNK